MFTAMLVTLCCLRFWLGGMPVLLESPCVTSFLLSYCAPRMTSFFVYIRYN
jgi:hypothetical protein